MPGSTLPQTDTQSRTRLPADQLDVADRAESETVQLSDGVRIHRTRHERDFTILSNHLIRDPNLGPFAVGVLARILSNVGNWHVTAKSMWEEGRKRGRKESRNDYQNAFTEMEMAGYMTRKRLSVPNDNGRGNKMITDVHYYDVALPESQRTSYAATGKKRSSENQTPVVGTTCGNTTNAQVTPRTSSRLSEPPAETRKSPGRSENRQSDVIKKDQEIRLSIESSSPLRGEPHDDEAEIDRPLKDSGEGSSAPVGEGAGQDRPSAPTASAASPTGDTSTARSAGKATGSASRAKREPDEFDELAQKLTEVWGSEYEASLLAPQLRRVARKAGISADATEDMLCWWRGEFAPARFNADTVDEDGNKILPNPGGYLHSILPDLVQAYLPARNEKAEELGVDPATFDLYDYLQDQAEANDADDQDDDEGPGEQERAEREAVEEMDVDAILRELVSRVVN